MLIVLFGVLLVVGAVIVWWWLSRQQHVTPRRQRSVVPPEALAPSMQLHAEPMPDALASFVWISAASVSEEHREALLARLRVIPQPPPALHKLLSAEFMASASSVELGELVKGVPLIAAKVLAMVNSPVCCLQRPVSSLGQAVTFLGLNAVRGLCLQYMIKTSFKADGYEQKKVFDAIWQSSASASNLCARLGHALAWPDQGALVTQVVLYFLGQVATYALLPKDVAGQLQASAGLLDRLRVEQAQLGLNSSEIGALLMREWALPYSIIADVRDIDHVLDTPVNGFEPARGDRLALCYLCIRLGEGLVAGQALDELMAQVAAGEQPEFWHLQDYLRQPGLAHLPEVILKTAVTPSEAAERS